MNNNLLPFLILVVAIIGVVINPKNNLILRITVVSISAVLFVVNHSGDKISEALILLFAIISLITVLFFYTITVRKRI